MHRPAIKSSARLHRAAQAESRELQRERQRLSTSREGLLAQLRNVERSIAEVDERILLLAQLAPDRSSAPARGRESNGEGDRTDDGRMAPEVLKGPAIREMAVRLVVQRGNVEALHYRAWFELLGASGYSVAGKDPLAVFLTQISRSPAVRKATQAGIYEVDRRAPERLRRELERLQAELRELTGRTTGTADLSEIRARRERLTIDIGKAERALEEAQHVLAVPDADSQSLAAAG